MGDGERFLYRRIVNGVDVVGPDANGNMITERTPLAEVANARGIAGAMKVVTYGWVPDRDPAIAVRPPYSLMWIEHHKVVAPDARPGATERVASCFQDIPVSEFSSGMSRFKVGPEANPPSNVVGVLIGTVFIDSSRGFVVSPRISIGVGYDRTGIAVWQTIVMDAQGQKWWPAGSLEKTAEIFTGWTLDTLALMHCRNVSTRPVTRGDPRKRHRHPWRYEHHVIDIPGLDRPASVGGSKRSGDNTTALHMVRGNYATYTEDRPLFGRDVGTFWRPAHARGKYVNGLVTKEYRHDNT
jgi:hypothetical protein